MAKVFDRIDDHLRAWIARQSMFFVGTAPLAADGHVNVSPKGPIGSLRVLDDHTVAYLDVYGSGTETIGHLRENGRIVVMLCAFDGPPRRTHNSLSSQKGPYGSSFLARCSCRYSSPLLLLRMFRADPADRTNWCSPPHSDRSSPPTCHERQT